MKYSVLVVYGAALSHRKWILRSSTHLRSEISLRSGFDFECKAWRLMAKEKTLSSHLSGLVLVAPISISVWAASSLWQNICRSAVMRASADLHLRHEKSFGEFMSRHSGFNNSSFIQLAIDGNRWNHRRTNLCQSHYWVAVFFVFFLTSHLI